MPRVKPVSKFEHVSLERVLVLALGVLLVVGAITGSVWYFYKAPAVKVVVKPTPGLLPIGPIAPASDPNVVPKTAVDKANVQVANGDYTGAMVDLRAQVGLAKDASAKAAAYHDLFQVAYNAKQFTQALGYAQQADALVSSVSTKGAVGLAAFAAGKYQLAYDSFQTAASLSPDNGADARSDRVNYNTLAIQAKAKL